MALLLDMVDDFYDNFDLSKRGVRDMPLLFVPHSRGRLHHHRHPGALQKMPLKTSDDFQTAINVQSFKPEEISVKVKGHEIFIEGKHEEREDDHGYISRQFTRRYVLPEAYDMDTVATYLDADGKMIIKARKPKTVEGPKERIIPIERVASEPKAVQNGTEEKKKETEYQLEDVME
jgi:hypothetical protein